MVMKFLGSVQARKFLASQERFCYVGFDDVKGDLINHSDSKRMYNIYMAFKNHFFSLA
jgi:hypothetical protein